VLWRMLKSLAIHAHDAAVSAASSLASAVSFFLHLTVLAVELSADGGMS
jgi:hypothetical protein